MYGDKRHVQQFTDRERALGHARQIGVSLAEYDAQHRAGRKWCFRCRRFTPVADFGRNRSNRDGLANMCRACLLYTSPSPRDS